eukprot:Skav208631  [mRNA]  locus=scaffold3433:82882:84512:- [translate_table: standard]
MAALGADAGAESSLAAAGDLVLRTSYGAVSSATTATCAEEATWRDAPGDGGRRHGMAGGMAGLRGDGDGRDNPLAPFMAEPWWWLVSALAPRIGQQQGCVASSSSLALAWKPTAVASTVTVREPKGHQGSGGEPGMALGEGWIDHGRPGSVYSMGSHA